MKPLKGTIDVYECGPERDAFIWDIVIPGRAKITTWDAFATRKSAMSAAKRFAARCNIVLEQSK